MDIIFFRVSSRSRSTSSRSAAASAPRLSGSEFWSRLRSPSVSRRSRLSPASMDQENSHLTSGLRSKSSSRVGPLSVLTPSSANSRRFGQELNTRDCRQDRLVKIKCLRLKEDKSKEEIEIEVPEAVFENLEDNSSPKSLSSKRSTNLLSYFGKGLNK